MSELEQQYPPSSTPKGVGASIYYPYPHNRYSDHFTKARLHFRCESIRNQSQKKRSRLEDINERFELPSVETWEELQGEMQSNTSEYLKMDNRSSTPRPRLDQNEIVAENNAVKVLNLSRFFIDGLHLYKSILILRSRLSDDNEVDWMKSIAMSRLHKWTTVQTDIVERIASGKGSDRRQLICQTEFSDLSEDQVTRLMPLLWQYAIENRDSNAPLDIVAVGSAIRQYVAAMEVANLGQVADLLDSGHPAVIPLQVELEVAKMVFRKFDANPPAERDPQPKLAERFAAMILDYLTPRVLPREQYAAVTILAIQALAVMRSPATQAIVAPLNASPFTWFRRQLRRRLEHIVNSWGQRHVLAETVSDLSSFLGQIRHD